MSSREGRRWAASGRGALVSSCAAAAWRGLLLLPLSTDALYDPAVDRRARMAAGCAVCAVAALGADLFGYRTSAVFLPALAVLVGLWLGCRRRPRQALAAAVEQPSVESQPRAEAARIGERSRIAAETRDVLTHRRILIAPHTGGPATKDDSLPAPVAERIGPLRTTSVEALADLRDALGVLREPVTPRPGTTCAPVTVRADHRPPATLTEVACPPRTPRTDTLSSGRGLVAPREPVTAPGSRPNAGPAGAGPCRLAARILRLPCPAPLPHLPRLPRPAALDQNGTRP
ncbi:histidine kinase dimerization/phosphoacceptor domain-containing protein [Streptomyces sp. NPDC005474]|uniref:histidine kinase dimerization/phosphoacceptor domain-containing protein n=1 Tax=Streptomyces sp. NPDC005474 TaxID=3154878 RepID=UPI003454A977